MRVVPKSETWTKNLEDLIDEDARDSEQSAPVPNGAVPDHNILDRLDWLEGVAEGRVEIDRLSQELGDFVSDKRAELKTLRSFRLFVTLVAILLMVGVASLLVHQLWTGFALFKGVIHSELIFASYVGASLAFLLGILLVLLRGIFGAIKEIDTAHYVPPQVQEIYSPMKKIRGD